MGVVFRCSCCRKKGVCSCGASESMLSKGHIKAAGVARAERLGGQDCYRGVQADDGVVEQAGSCVAGTKVACEGAWLEAAMQYGREQIHEAWGRLTREEKNMREKE